MKNLIGLALGGWLSLLTVTPSWAQTKLKIENVQAAFGPFGPERKVLDIYPFDSFSFRFTIVGLKTGAGARVDTAIKLQLTDASGKIFLENSFPSKGMLYLGGDSFLAYANIAMQEQVPEGKITLKITAADNVSKESASVERELTGKKGGFHIVALEFFHDPEGRVPASTHLALGQVLYFQMRVIGFDRTLGKIDTQLALQTLDADGKENLPKPLLTVFRQDDAKVVEKTTFIFFNGSMGMNRAGSFTMRLTATDQIGHQTSKEEIPLIISAP